MASLRIEPKYPQELRYQPSFLKEFTRFVSLSSGCPISSIESFTLQYIQYIQYIHNNNTDPPPEPKFHHKFLEFTVTI